MSQTKAVIFDLDMTLVDSSALASWRRKKFWRHVMANLKRVKPFGSGSFAAHELPTRLRERGHRVAVVTSSKRGYAKAVLKRFGIEHDVLVAYEDTAQHKPDPEPLTTALRRLRAKAPDAVYVGDSVFDTEAAYHAGVQSVGAGWGVQNFDEFCSAAPDILMSKPELLLKIANLDRLGYVAEVCALGTKPLKHAGSFLSFGTSLRMYALGRYCPRADSRHATSELSQLLVEFKRSDAPASIFASALAAFIEQLDWTPDYVVSVPPKPSQKRNRFEALFAAAGGLLGDDIEFCSDGLRCRKELSGYRTMDALQRSAAVSRAFGSKYLWPDARVLLVDDVLTTGETVAECARVLLAKGAAEVRVVVIGKDQQVFERKTCPACGRPMRVRRSGKGVNFWGCSGYPTSAGKLKIFSDVSGRERP